MENIALLAQNTSMIVLFKLTLALLLGAVLGLERVFAHRPAGVRTYALVAMGSSLFIIVSELVSLKYLDMGINPDPLKVASNILVGIGFLGAGVIIFKDSTLVGLTTAAGLWVSAAIGMAVGFGFFEIGIIATLLTLFIFTLLWYVERFLLRFHEGKDEPGR